MDVQTRKQLHLLWVDLSVSSTEAPSSGDAREIFSDYFEVTCSGRGVRIGRQFVDARPDAVVFDFDYPDRTGLQLVEEVKQRFPSVPMFVVTLQHSEELAVWAFRAGMKDFLVKPLKREDLTRCYDTMRSACRARHGQRRRSIRGAQTELRLPACALNRLKGARTQLDPAIYFVEHNYREKIRSETVATICQMSPFRFSRMFKEVYGIAFRDYVVRYRLREAASQLQTGQVSVTEVALSAGFNDVAYFSRIFKKYFKVAPSTYAKSLSVEHEKPVPDSTISETLRLPVH